jgi:hypothetical protein
MSRQPSHLLAQRNTHLLACIGALKVEHLFWGYPRIWAHLHFVEQLATNKKRSLRPMYEHHDGDCQTVDRELSARA